MRPYLKLLCLSAVATTTTSLDLQAKSKTERPNILLAIADDISFPHMGAYGCSWLETPAFDEVAKNGVLFNNAYTPNAKSAPSRACILTGRNSWQLEEACNHMPYFPLKFTTFPEALSRNGYKVGYTGKGWAPGVALDENGKRRDLLVKPYNKIKCQPPTTQISIDDYAENFKVFLDEKKSDEPFFFWYGGWEPHRAYEYGSSIKYGKKLEEIDKVFDFWPDTEAVRTDMLDYAFELEYFDQQLQKILAELKSRNMLDNTLVIVTADNGMPFPRIKGQGYEMSNHLPLTIMWRDGIKHIGRTIDDFVNFIDIAPTILELAGVSEQSSQMQSITGRSLTDILYSKKSGKVVADRDHILIGKERHDIGRPNNEGYPIRGIRRGDYLYIRNFKTDRWPAGNPQTGYPNCDAGATKTEILHMEDERREYFWNLTFGKRPSEELYNISEDPYCMNNLAESEDLQEIKKALNEEMVQKLAHQQDPRIVGDGDIFDHYKIFPAKYMDYYEHVVNGEVTPKLHWLNDTDYQPRRVN